MKTLPTIRSAGAGTLLALILAGCGGGDDGATPAVTSGKISGVVSKGPVHGANVCAYAITGGAKGSLIGTCQTTDTSGNYIIDVGSYTGDVLFEASGGSYVDEATGATVDLASPLHGMLTSVAGGQAIAAITALTELAYQVANARVGNLTATNIQSAVVSVQNNFGVADIASTLPVDALSVPEQATDTQKSYALALATVSQYIKGQPAGSSLTNALQTMQACLSVSTSCGTLGSELGNAASAFQATHASFSGLTPAVANFGAAAVSATPIVTGFSPTTGVADTVVTITGTHLNSFVSVPLVKFGTTTATVTSTADSGGLQLTVSVPSGLAEGNNTITISNSDGTGAQSVGEFNLTVPGSGAAVGAAPIGLTPTTLSSNQISLTWTASADSNYNIYRSTTPLFTISSSNLIGNYSGASIILGALGQGPFVDKHLTPATTYYYKITKIPFGGTESLASAAMSATTNALSGIIGADWIDYPIGSGAAITSVAWSGSKFVAVDMIGNAHTSADGMTWAPNNTGITIPLTAITWSGSQFVAVGQQGKVVTSPDGVTWTIRSSGTTSYLYGITWSGTQFVAVGGNSTVITSSNGIAWSTQNSGLTVLVSLTSVSWSGSGFVAVGSGGKIIASTDGVYWFAAASYTSNNLQSVAWNGSKFFVVGAGGLVMSSSNGTTWSQTALGRNTTLNSLIWTGSQFIAAGNSGTILRSPDGITWSQAPSGTVLNLFSIAGAGSKFVVVGQQVAVSSL